ncbi:RNA-directed DNA polymerase (reverse transcriptase [Striga hermonthica]|uniref:RNA-directed DNA polymerase (reverse transcriptase) n=1 Tax=Striga hermonthica TaxID=68872 RepID=A0A9N7RGD0_STRHE|nr:RNA-directed DNA polymerase (reverse transcriptase [Striga hermonthica]
MLSTFVRKPKAAAIATVVPLLPVRFSTLRHPQHGPNPDLQSLVLSRYRGGKFHGLLQNVVASPSVLLTACQNLCRPVTTPTPPSITLDSVSARFFSLHDLSLQLSNNFLDVESCCVRFSPEDPKGEPLVLPDLKLKVVLEAIRIVLEIIYDDRFATFSYGGRTIMGRHTAVRYLKNSIENPSWWFTVKFNKGLFGPGHVDKLCVMLGKKIEDNALIDLIRKLFECKVLAIDLGGLCLGRGLPQECCLSSILINVSFNSFDQKIQELRLKVNNENPKFKESELSPDGLGPPRPVFYKPLKIYAIRYLNEILIVTSGSKMLTLDLKNLIVDFLTRDLDLNVDKSKTVIHSAVSEKIDFLGMDLQAVAPSIIRPRKTEKAIRAHKKYLRQKEVRLLELKNKRERNRKKLGMKLLSHVHKKLRRGSSFEFDFQIENEVTEVFATWGHEVVRGFLSSVDERWEWHRKLSGGDFLSLARIRDQLPRDLVEAYDNFQTQIDKHLKPVKAKKELAETLRRKEQEEEEKYSRKTVDDLTRRLVKVEAPLDLLKKAVKLVGFTNKMGRPRPLSLLTVVKDADIVKWYAGIAKRWLDFYRCCHNFRKVKIIVSYHLRFSCLLTLAEKHEATKQETMRHFTKDLIVLDANGDERAFFPSEKEIKMMGEGNLADPIPVDGCLTMVLTRLESNEPWARCAAHFCESRDDTVVVYRIHLLQKYLNLDTSDEEEWVARMGAVHDSMHGKCLPLCSEHVSELYMGRLTLRDVDSAGFLEVD